jgi:hypothetical protein
MLRRTSIHCASTFKWVNSVYRRCYDHYQRVINQAAAEAQTEQAWLDYASGAAIGITVGLIGEAIIAGRAAEKALEGIAEVSGEFIEGGISANVKFDVPVPKIAPELSPALRQVQSLQKLDDLSAAVLPMATGSQVYTDMRLSAPSESRLTYVSRKPEASAA